MCIRGGKKKAVKTEKTQRSQPPLKGSKDKLPQSDDEVTTSGDSSNKDTLSNTTIALVVLTVVFGVLNIILIGVIVNLLYAPKDNRDTSMAPASSLNPSDQLERGSSNPSFNPVHAKDAKK
jgi:hypothetical protein